MLKDECEHRRLVQSRQFVAKVHQNAPNCEVAYISDILRGNNTPGSHTGDSVPRHPWSGSREREWKGRENGAGGKRKEGRGRDRPKCYCPIGLHT